jgi:adenosine receptor A2a
MLEAENITTLYTEEFYNFTSSDDDFWLSNGTSSPYPNITAINHEEVHRNTELNIPYTIMEGLVAFVAVIGNGLVIIVFYRERRLRRRTNYYIISLALADFLVGLIGVPFAILVSNEN